MRNLFLYFFLFILSACSQNHSKPDHSSGFIKVSGPDLILPSGEKFFIRGTNLGNWLNPEGYMFLFKNAGSPRLIDNGLRELVGPDFTNQFWKTFKDRYVTREDIQFLKSTGLNTLRFPFHYKLFTDEDYLGLTAHQDGFARTDSLIKWCKEAEIYLILDMHDAPGGQTGANIDDSYGYPFLFTSPESQDLFVEIWAKIAARYHNEPIILGYDLLNEPIATYFKEDEEFLNAQLEPLFKRATEAIRKVDNNHVIIFGGAQWNQNFSVFSDWTFDDNLMYSCHRYGGKPNAEALSRYIAFRDSTNRPMYMGEIGHNTNEWISEFSKIMTENNMGYTFWPYKKMGDSTSFVNVKTPEYWESIRSYMETPRVKYSDIYEARSKVNLDSVKMALNSYLDHILFKNTRINDHYIKAMGLKVESN